MFITRVGAKQVRYFAQRKRAVNQNSDRLFSTLSNPPSVEKEDLACRRFEQVSLIALSNHQDSIVRMTRHTSCSKLMVLVSCDCVQPGMFCKWSDSHLHTDVAYREYGQGQYRKYHTWTPGLPVTGSGVWYLLLEGWYINTGSSWTPWFDVTVDLYSINPDQATCHCYVNHCPSEQELVH